jgi:hypothetical protein
VVCDDDIYFGQSVSPLNLEFVVGRFNTRNDFTYTEVDGDVVLSDVVYDN